MIRSRSSGEGCREVPTQGFSADRIDVGVGEILDPGGVVQHLADNVAGRPSALQLQHHGVPIAIKGEQVDSAPVGSVHLPTNNQEIHPEQRRVGGEPALEPLFDIEAADWDFVQPRALDPPQVHSQGHGRARLLDASLPLSPVGREVKASLITAGPLKLAQVVIPFREASCQL